MFYILRHSGSDHCTHRTHSTLHTPYTLHTAHHNHVCLILSLLRDRMYMTGIRRRRRRSATVVLFVVSEVSEVRLFVFVPLFQVFLCFHSSHILLFSPLHIFVSYLPFFFLLFSFFYSNLTVATFPPSLRYVTPYKSRAEMIKTGAVPPPLHFAVTVCTRTTFCLPLPVM